MELNKKHCSVEELQIAINCIVYAVILFGWEFCHSNINIDTLAIYCSLFWTLSINNLTLGARILI